MANVTGLSVPAIVCQVMNCPTKPAVPIPAPEALFVMWKTIVDTGPSMALAIIAGSHITGFFIMFGTCNILVPSDNKPPTLFSL